ncbi:MAG: hypothetical protein B7Z80_27420, partial [Rhodospirillales bacterium 20-64-7]
GVTTAMAQPYDHHDGQHFDHHYDRRDGWYDHDHHWHRWHHWRPGDRYDGPRYIVHRWRYYHLPPPPPGAYWVNEGGRFVLVGGNGLVIRLFVP